MVLEWAVVSKALGVTVVEQYAVGWHGALGYLVR